ncbi:MAG: DNA polymerase-1, partial [Rickettsiales bacterium]
MSSNNQKIVLIDGYGFVFRAFHSLPPLTRPDGTPVGAVYGFTSMIIKLLANLKTSHIAMVFDSGSKTFRNEIYSDYKANRPPCPDDLKPQFSIVREAAEALSLPILERVGFEADDLIATVAKQASKKGFEVVIVSSDKDLMQLVSQSNGENVTMYDAMKNRMIGEAEVEEKFNVKTTQVLDVLSLMGDASDNVPGVRGIGPKTAAELINKYQTLENLFEHLD